MECGRWDGASRLLHTFRFEAVDAGHGSESLDNYTARWFSISITQVLSVSEILETILDQALNLSKFSWKFDFLINS